MVRIVVQATSGIDPKWVMMAPVSAVQKIWQKTGWKNDDVDLYDLATQLASNPSATPTPSASPSP